VKTADLVIACTSRDEVNLVAGMFARREAKNATSVIRTSNVEYVELWREGQLDVDFVVSSELETAHAISRIIGVPAARQTDVFAEGQVQIVEFDVQEGASDDVVGVPLRDARFPRDSKVAAILHGDSMRLPGGNDVVRSGDRIVIIGSPHAAQEWSALLAPGESKVKDVVIFGAGHVGSAIARVLLEQGISVRMIESSRAQAFRVAEALPKVRTYHATGIDPDFLERERIGQADAAIFAMRDDAKNLYAASLAKVHGVKFTVAIAHEAVSSEAFEQAGIDVSVNPRGVTSEEIIRFAHDPRTQQVALLEGNRYEVIDVTLRDTSEYIGKRFQDMPIRGALIGAVVRNGSAIFPHRDDVLESGDRVIVFTEAADADRVVKAL
jgi:trk system potassium uptake protein